MSSKFLERGFARYVLAPALAGLTLVACSFTAQPDTDSDSDISFFGALMSSLDGMTGPSGANYLIGELSDGDNFGQSSVEIGDLDGDGVPDLLVGAPFDGDGGSARGAAYVLFMNYDGTIKDGQKISDTEGNFTAVLDNDDRFGYSVASLGDLDGDGVLDVAVGARRDDDGGNNRGAVYILFLDTDGTVKSHQKISNTEGSFSGGLGGGDQFGYSMTSIGDLDGDTVTDLVVGAFNDDDGGSNRGAVYVLFLNTDGTVDTHQKISDTDGGFSGLLDNGDKFGWSVANLGDVDGDTITDIAVGAAQDDDGGSNRGAVYVLFLNANGTVSSDQKISDIEGSFTGTLGGNDRFGTAIAGLGDLDGDTVPDMIVGAYNDDDGGSNRGGVYVLFLETDGTVDTHRKISHTHGHFAGSLDNGDKFGSSLSTINLQNDAIPELLIGAIQDDDGGSNRGALWLLSQNADGTVGAFKKLSSQGTDIGCTVSGSLSGVESPVTSSPTSRPESTTISESPCIYVPPPPPSACSVGGPTVIDTSTVSTALDSIVTAAGNIIVARNDGSALRLFSTNCKREEVETPYEALSFGLNPSLARFQGTTTSAIGHTGLDGSGAFCGVSKIDDDANLVAGPVVLVGHGSGFNLTDTVSLASGNVMVLCRDGTNSPTKLVTFVIDSNLNTVSGPNNITGDAIINFGNSAAELSDGRVVLTYRDDNNSQRGTIRILSSTGTSVAGPFTFTTGSYTWRSVLSLGTTAVAIYGEAGSAMKMVEINTNGAVIGGPWTLDTTGSGLINWTSAERASDGSIYVSYFPSGALQMRYLRVSTGGTVLGGPYDFGSSNTRPQMNLVNDHVVITSNEGVYVFEQD